MHRHDTLWKGLLQAFFPDFLAAVVPEVSVHLDAESRTFLEQEAFTDLHKGRKALLDLLAEVPSRDGPKRVVLVHVEVERRFGGAMDERMWRYYAHLTLKYGLPIVPIVLFLRGGRGGVTRRTVHHRVAGTEVCRLSYWSLGLAGSKVDELLRHGPLGVALASCVRRDLPRPTQRLRCMEALASCDVDPAQEELLIDAIQTYMPLSAQQKINYEQQVVRSPKRAEVSKMEELTWAGKLEQKYRKIGHRQGLEAGHRQGLEAGRRDVGQRLLLKILATRFGSVPADLEVRIRGLDDIASLESVSERALTASSLSEVEAFLET
ncbi:MAG: DUF4351 domain-containing protein [Acidobacteriota bacterium]